MAARQLSDGNDDGTILGQDGDDLVGFHGTTGTARTSLTTLATGATAVSLTLALQSVIAYLRTKGLAG